MEQEKQKVLMDIVEIANNSIELKNKVIELKKKLEDKFLEEEAISYALTVIRHSAKDGCKSRTFNVIQWEINGRGSPEVKVTIPVEIVKSAMVKLTEMGFSGSEVEGPKYRISWE